MSLEAGGRADKYGNEYENKYLLTLLLRVVSGRLLSVVVEPLGENKDSVEYISVTPQGEKWFHQCKASNMSKTNWSVADLRRYDVFSRSRKILSGSADNRYEFISPLSYGELAELCKRARTNASPEEFVQEQLTNNPIKKVFAQCKEAYGLSDDDPNQLRQLTDFLSRSNFETVPDGIEAVRDLEDKVSLYFSGNPSQARILLQNFVNSQGLCGREIAADDVISYMEKQGCTLRRHLLDNNAHVAIKDLNELFYDSFNPINGTLYHRDAVDRVMDSVKGHRSVVLHGKAGIGKSGCVQEIINCLKAEMIPFLALKLDKQAPKSSPDAYGKGLGLEQSPVYSVYFASGKKPCVVILDQLDSVRWTSADSANALDVCKQMVRQTERLNESEGGQISLILISRTFDLATNTGLQSLFDTKGDRTITWDRIAVSEFTYEEAKSILGPEYDTYPKKLQELLRTPSTMYIWSRLSLRADVTSATTSQELMQKWWDQILVRCAASNVSRDRILDLKERIVKAMVSGGALSLPIDLFPDDGIEMDKLISEGLLVRSGSVIAFSHQCFFDYFATSDTLKKVYAGAPLTDIIGNYDDQTPFHRYRFLSLLQLLLDADEQKYLALAREIIHSPDIRYYYRFAVPETVGQREEPSYDLLGFAYSLYLDSEWHDVALMRIYRGHLPFVKDLDSREAIRLSEDEGTELLRSVYEASPDYIVARFSGITPHDEQEAIRIFSIFSPDLSFDTPASLNMGLSLAESYPVLFDRFWGIAHLVGSRSLHLIPILERMIRCHDKINDHHFYLGNEKEIAAYCEKNHREILRSLLPAVCEVTAHFDPADPNLRFSKGFEKWTPQRYAHKFARTIVELLTDSIKAYYKADPQNFISYIRGYDGQKSVLWYEIIAEGISSMDVADSDFAVGWLCDDPGNHMFIYTGCQDDYLSLTKKIIEKFSPHCSEPLFRRLEELICRWKDPLDEMLQVYQWRREVSRNECAAYYAYWGMFQKELLPKMDPARLSKEARELLGVVNRNTWIHTPHYYCGFSSFDAGGVTSPVDKKAGRISDRTWLSIVATPEEKMGKRFSRKPVEGNYIDATHHSFASSLSFQAQKEPERFARLALRFPENCNLSYITGVLNAIRYPDEGAPPACRDSVVRLIERYKNVDIPLIIKEIMGIIEKHSEWEWPDELIDLVIRTALSAPDEPDIGRTNPFSDKVASPIELYSDVSNSVPGSAIKTMSALLKAHRELARCFMPTIKTLSNHKSDTIRFALMFCVFALCDQDEKHGLKLFRKLLKRELRVIGFPNVWDLILDDRKAHGRLYARKLAEAVHSGIDDLSNDAAVLLCAYTVFFNNTLLPKLCTSGYTEQQADAICRQAIFSFDTFDCHSISRDILLYFIRHYDADLRSLELLFTDRRVDIISDEAFLTELMRSNHAPRVISEFLKYINEQEHDITRYIDMIRQMSETVPVDKNDWAAKRNVNELILIVLKLLEQNASHRENKHICMDIWDNIYRNYFELVKPVAELLESDEPSTAVNDRI